MVLWFKQKKQKIVVGITYLGSTSIYLQADHNW